jgi:hypothetical protein
MGFMFHPRREETVGKYKGKQERFITIQEK